MLVVRVRVGDVADKERDRLLVFLDELGTESGQDRGRVKVVPVVEVMIVVVSIPKVEPGRESARAQGRAVLGLVFSGVRAVWRALALTRIEGAPAADDAAHIRIIDQGVRRFPGEPQPLVFLQLVQKRFRNIRLVELVGNQRQSPEPCVKFPGVVRVSHPFLPLVHEVVVLVMLQSLHHHLGIFQRPLVAPHVIGHGQGHSDFGAHQRDLRSYHTAVASRNLFPAI
mmetsp:Transcript_26143/g.48750  ORF Transcript_26143/g.48750 Transcript_26143/m.48750 type:complete len:226 (+) Transcript_26143:807-1484(+)